MADLHSARKMNADGVDFHTDRLAGWLDDFRLACGSAGSNGAGPARGLVKKRVYPAHPDNRMKPDIGSVRFEPAHADGRAFGETERLGDFAMPRLVDRAVVDERLFH